MNKSEEIKTCINERTAHILTYAQAAVTESQYKAFRKLILDEMGNKGLASDVDKILTQSSQQQDRKGTGRNIFCKEGGAP